MPDYQQPTAGCPRFASLLWTLTWDTWQGSGGIDREAAGSSEYLDLTAIESRCATAKNCHRCRRAPLRFFPRLRNTMCKEQSKTAILVFLITSAAFPQFSFRQAQLKTMARKPTDLAFHINPE